MRAAEVRSVEVKPPSRGNELFAVTLTASVTPSAAELGKMVELLRREKIRVVFAEEGFPQPLLKVLRDQGQARVYQITHLASGQYMADKFEKGMQKNLDSMVKALVTDAGS